MMKTRGLVGWAKAPSGVPINGRSDQDWHVMVGTARVSILARCEASTARLCPPYEIE